MFFYVICSPRKRSISTEGQGGNVVTLSLNLSNLSSSNLSSNKFDNSSSSC